MLPFRLLDCVATPDGRELVLYQRGDSFSIQIDHHDLMSSRAHGSEDELARLALATLGPRPAPRVLIGGLGMGFTLRAALDTLGGSPDAAVVVAELFPAVVGWNRSHLGHLAKRPLDDPRVEVVERDVAELLQPAAFDAILLDVDNGPEALTFDANRHLYSSRGVARLHDALAPGGVLAVWSAGEDPSFVARLQRSGLSTRIHRPTARAGGRGDRHVVFVGRRDGLQAGAQLQP